MEGVYVIEKGRFVTSIRQGQAELGLLTSYGDIDIMLQELGPGRPSWIEPGSDPDLMEFYYILDGSLELCLDEGPRRMQKGDSFYVVNLKEPFAIKTDTGMRFLYITTKPVFNALYSFSGDLNELLRQCEEKDRYTKNHSSRVMDYSIKICGAMGLSNDATEKLVVSSLFHDIGKCMIPDEILNKPARLTREEFRYIMKHPIFSRTLVENKFGREIGEIVEQHHERIDGSGYPFGLCGDEIRLEAKIIAVADSYDAMTTIRPYKEAVSPGEALEELRSETGTLYDENVVRGMESYLRHDRLI